MTLPVQFSLFAREFVVLEMYRTFVYVEEVPTCFARDLHDARELPLTKVKGYEPIAFFECTKREEIKEMFQHSHNKKKGCRSRL